MGFFKDLMNATPGKSRARATELHQAGINDIWEYDEEVLYVNDCCICKVRFGEIFAKDSRPMLVIVREPEKLSFISTRDSAAGIIICHRCVHTFGFHPSHGQGPI
jgi:hypothetical protein